MPLGSVHGNQKIAHVGSSAEWPPSPFRELEAKLSPLEFGIQYFSHVYRVRRTVQETTPIIPEYGVG